MREHNDTIVALSTPVGAGIAVIRLSGPDAGSVLRDVFRAARVLRPRRLTYGHAVSAGGDIIDEVMAVYMPAPGTYTREAMAEVHCHGGGATVRAVLARLISAGARPAEPGEFTKRAFINGRIDLSQAEAVMALIAASTEVQARHALSQLGGELSGAIGEYEEKLTAMLSAIEAAIDFPDEIDEVQTAGEITVMLSNLADGLERSCSPKMGRILREGINVVVAGKPNVGKSSIVNALLRREVSIVTDVPGTTRDALTTPLSLGGMLVQLTDTAGLRETDEPVERIGVSRAAAALREADVLLLVLDASKQFDAEDDEAFRQVIGAGVPFIVILNKSDLPPVIKRETVCAHAVFAAYGGIDARGGCIAEVSAATGEGLDALGGLLADCVGALSTGDSMLTGERHIEAALRAVTSMRAASLELREGQSLDCAAIDIRDALHAVGEITGKAVDEAVIDRIFADFCVGK